MKDIIQRHLWKSADPDDGMTKLTMERDENFRELRIVQNDKTLAIIRAKPDGSLTLHVVDMEVTGNV